ncbi:uncharacterized protein MONBRDRAFT_26295 [Monosiga brevicollis MX1]|uniref:FERM domain-containing protein n=1 Tax=Monosiga brevicollis TaxID=81824 RepID=A9V1Y7_MONBE|nr:uncharacterized protein MONBRDRAFT_26295 [Monosiga brevicollis MX1]EDQ88524.1 predicted protein [Monosiga brevicollis MX1]|eukprot:XP_001746628.1 hypothetical protein [Monosiga brevicollis MX1]
MAIDTGLVENLAASTTVADPVELVITLLDGTEVPITCSEGKHAPAESIRDLVAERCKIPPEDYRLFAIWVASDSLQLQVKDHQSPIKVLKAWPELIHDYTQVLADDETELPVIYFRRQALGHERATEDVNTLTMLVRELTYNVVYSLYPVDRELAVSLAAIHLQLACGHEATKDDVDPTPSLFVRDSDIEGCLMPPHLKSFMNVFRPWRQAVLAARAELTISPDATFELMQRYLELGRQSPLYAAVFFFGQLEQDQTGMTLRERPDIDVRVGVNLDGVHVVDDKHDKLLYSLTFADFAYNLFEDEETGEACFLIEYERPDADPDTAPEERKTMLHIWSKQAELLDTLVSEFEPIVLEWQHLCAQRAAEHDGHGADFLVPRTITLGRTIRAHKWGGRMDSTEGRYEVQTMRRRRDWLPFEASFRRRPRAGTATAGPQTQQPAAVAAPPVELEQRSTESDVSTTQTVQTAEL